MTPYMSITLLAKCALFVARVVAIEETSTGGGNDLREKILRDIDNQEDVIDAKQELLKSFKKKLNIVNQWMEDKNYPERLNSYTEEQKETAIKYAEEVDVTVVSISRSTESLKESEQKIESLQRILENLPIESTPVVDATKQPVLMAGIPIVDATKQLVPCFEITPEKKKSVVEEAGAFPAGSKLPDSFTDNTTGRVETNRNFKIPSRDAEELAKPTVDEVAKAPETAKAPVVAVVVKKWSVVKIVVVVVLCVVIVGAAIALVFVLQQE